MLHEMSCSRVHNFTWLVNASMRASNCFFYTLQPSFWRCKCRIANGFQLFPKFKWLIHPHFSAIETKYRLWYVELSGHVNVRFLLLILRSDVAEQQPEFITGINLVEPSITWKWVMELQWPAHIFNFVLAVHSLLSPWSLNSTISLFNIQGLSGFWCPVLPWEHSSIRSSAVKRYVVKCNRLIIFSLWIGT